MKVLPRANDRGKIPTTAAAAAAAADTDANPQHLLLGKGRPTRRDEPRGMMMRPSRANETINSCSSLELARSEESLAAFFLLSMSVRARAPKKAKDGAEMTSPQVLLVVGPAFSRLVSSCRFWNWRKSSFAACFSLVCGARSGRREPWHKVDVQSSNLDAKNRTLAAARVIDCDVRGEGGMESVDGSRAIGL